jgi:hypothetical protein
VARISRCKFARIHAQAGVQPTRQRKARCILEKLISESAGNMHADHKNTPATASLLALHQAILY